MSRSVVSSIVLSLVLVLGAAAQAPPALTILRAGPTGELSQLEQGNEIRVVFSEPMVALGRIPARVEAPFVRLEPAVKGSFRWSGTTILIFTPDPGEPLPYATVFTVTIDRTARAVSGRQLAAPYTFEFTTPTTRLLRLERQRAQNRSDRPVLLYLRFNQPVDAKAILPHVRVQLAPYAWQPPQLLPAAEARLGRLDPVGLKQFRAKVAAVTAATRSSAAVPVRIAANWDVKAYPPSPDLVVLETLTVPPPQTQLQITLDGALPSPQGRATPSRDQQLVEPLEPAFFVLGFRCPAECVPSDRNPIRLTSTVPTAALRAATAVTNVSGTREVAVAAGTRPSVRDEWDQPGADFTLEDLRYPTQPPVSRYAVRVAPTLEAEDGQRLGYPWMGIVENWHERAFTSFGDGHGVWERASGNRLPFFARNVSEIRQWVTPLAPGQLMSRMLQLAGAPGLVPAGPGTLRRLAVDPDRIQAHGLDVSSALKADGAGLLWAGIEDGTAIPQSRPSWNPTGDVRQRRKSTIVQVTNLGVTVKDSPQNTLIFVTRLDTGEPVADARVSIVRRDESVFWRGATSADGIALAPDTPLRNPENPWGLSFVVIAEKGDDVAYVGSDWTEGLTPWEFGLRTDLGESQTLLRGTVFTDRGVYRLGEEVHFKAILRTDAGRGVQLLPAGTPVTLTTADARGRQVDSRTIRVTDWSSAEWTFRLPSSGPLGNYSVTARLDNRPEEESRFDYQRSVHGSFLVAAYRRPDFRVDATVTGGPTPIAGAVLNGTVSARYLFGAAMTGRPVTWKTSREPVLSAPEPILDRYLPDQWTFVGYDWTQDDSPQAIDLRSDQSQLSGSGELAVDVATERAAGVPMRYAFEAEVEDVSRQRIANRAALLVHPAPWYIGVRRIPYFADQKTGVQTAVVAVTPEGAVTPGVTVSVSLKQIQWNSVRRAEGGGFYSWDTERRVIDIDSRTVTTGPEPVPLSMPLPSGGSFVLTARAEDGDGRISTTVTSFYVLGNGYTAWSRYDHNRIDLVPERARYKPGETARIMIQSPWEQATALVTTEREGIRSSRRFALTSTQQTVSVPIAEADIPNVYVSVVLVKGRTNSDAPDDGSDPGKPSFRVGYVELQVEDASKRLAVDVRANQQEYRPANRAKVDVTVRDAAGRPVVGEVTLWAVDYGVLSLTNFQTPDVLRSVYRPKALQVFTEDNRQRLVSRRALVPKGADEGGGGGADAGAGTLRRDFRVLAFWIGSTVTRADGRATAELKLPESLTTYRIMAVAGDKASRFGWAHSEIRINKPVTLLPAFPRFLAVGDRAFFGSVVTNQLRSAGQAVVSIRSLDPALLRIEGAATSRAAVAAGGSTEVRFTATARGVGRARVQMSVRLNGETDAYEEIIPVVVLTPHETVAAYGQTQATASETLTVPRGVVPGFGGLTVQLGSTALVGLGEGARYLVEYPYGCAEQKASAALPLILAADLGEAFPLPGIDPAVLRSRAQSALKDLEGFQCASGGFALWPGACWGVSPYLTSYLLHVFRTAVEHGLDVDRAMLERAYDYLERALAQQPPLDDGSIPADLAWRAFAAKVLVEGGRNQDSTINRLLPQLDRMPVFALAHLLDALGPGLPERLNGVPPGLSERLNGVPPGNTRARERTELLRRIDNAVLEEAGSAHVEELTDPYLMWLWNSNVRSTSIVLGSLVRRGQRDLAQIQPMVRWLIAARRNGRWGSTQENAWALQALVAYYKTFEAEVPQFSATVALGRQTLMRETFSGRSTEAITREVPMRALSPGTPERRSSGSTGTPGRPSLTATTAPEDARALRFEKSGRGTLFYSARLQYVVTDLFQDALDTGFAISRSYTPFVDGNGGAASTTTFKAGDLVRVTLRLSLTKERRYVAVTDPLPAGFEAVESWFATTATDLARAQNEQGEPDGPGWWWQRGGFDHVERHDDRVHLFATRLSEGVHEFSYIARATTAGTFRTAPAHAEEMYEPEVFGRTATTTIEVQR
jgi:uncharacterized protein YfaS (alpha-2-macroglobulin family)